MKTNDQENPQMKKIAFGLALSAAVAAQIPASAAPIFLGVSPVKPTSSVQVDQQQLQVNNRPPLPFKPFAMVDPRSGQPLSSEAVITLKNGKQIKAGQYFAQLNQLEQQFNQMGYTLRQPGTFKLQALKIDQQQLQAQKALFQAQTAAGIKPVKAIFHTAGVTRKVGVLRPEVGLFQPGGANMGKTWSHSFGSRDTLGASFSGEINVNGSDNGLSANGVARASGAILGNEWDLIRVTGSLSAPKSGPGKATVNLYVVGVGDVPVLNQSLNQGGASVSNTVGRSLDVSQSFRFSVGPIPMSARLGIRGQAGVQYGMGVNATGINVSLKPKVQVDAYGQGGVDVVIASGGIGCDLALLHHNLELGVEGGLTVDGGAPALKGRLYGGGSMEVLAGHLYAFAKVDLLLWDDEWQWDIWNFAGIKANFTLFDEAKTMRFTAQQPVAVAG
jgi:hypothetical protein